MKLETKLKVNSIKRKLSNAWYDLMKPVVIWLEMYDKRKYEKFKLKVNTMTEEEVVDRIAKCIIKSFSKYPNGYEDIHIVKATDDWTERHIRNYIIDMCKTDKYVRHYGYNLKFEDVDTYRRLTEMLYSRLIDEDVLKVEWKVYDSARYWRGYEKTLTVEVKDEYLVGK